MVGDRRYDVEGARQHGLDAIGVLWGYGSRDELESAGAWAIAHTVDDLAALLLP
jgi:phosphoglycolate phosphatase